MGCNGSPHRSGYTNFYRGRTMMGVAKLLSMMIWSRHRMMALKNPSCSIRSVATLLMLVILKHLWSFWMALGIGVLEGWFYHVFFLSLFRYKNDLTTNNLWDVIGDTLCKGICQRGGHTAIYFKIWDLYLGLGYEDIHVLACSILEFAHIWRRDSHPLFLLWAYAFSQNEICCNLAGEGVIMFKLLFCKDVCNHYMAYLGPTIDISFFDVAVGH